ncbi:homeobox protein ceh-62 [Nematostella vectensis]|uniref:homeobox protein ceh-62 n=1 Tax=Nematostella vectensis TaxID=45351 RepID=UPI0020777BE2|nr:homeobox protein ceh-62 [Nematostella vectensis]
MGSYTCRWSRVKRRLCFVDAPSASRASKRYDFVPLVELEQPFTSPPHTTPTSVRVRKFFSAADKSRLLQEYESNIHPNKEQRTRLAQELRTKEKRIRTWFANKRARDRRNRNKLFITMLRDIRKADERQRWAHKRALRESLDQSVTATSLYQPFGTSLNQSLAATSLEASLSQSVTATPLYQPLTQSLPSNNLHQSHHEDSFLDQQFADQSPWQPTPESCIEYTQPFPDKSFKTTGSHGNNMSVDYSWLISMVTPGLYDISPSAGCH